MPTTKTTAKNLYNALKTGLQRPQEIVIQIIDCEAWVALDYQPGPKGFAEAWVDQMGGVPIARSIAPLIVYEMFEAGWSDAAIIQTLKGVGPAMVKSYKRQQESGVPPGAASIAYNEPESMNLFFGATRLREMRQAAAREGLTAKEIALAAVSERFEELGVG